MIPSEINSDKVLKNLVEKINNYHKTRDYPSIEGTSKISPYLKHGQIHAKLSGNPVIKLKIKIQI